MAFTYDDDLMGGNASTPSSVVESATDAAVIGGVSFKLLSKPTDENISATGDEYFDYKGVLAALKNLNSVFDSFSGALENCASDVATGIEAGLKSEGGSKLLNLWKSNYSTFSEFRTNFNSWVDMVIGVSKLEGGFESEVAQLFSKDIYQADALDINAVNDARIDAALNMGSAALAGVAFGVQDEEYKSEDGTTKWVVTDSEGNVTEFYKDKDGNVIKVVAPHVITDDKGNEVKVTSIKDFTTKGVAITKIQDDDGNLIQTVVHDSSGKVVMQESRVVSADGSVTYVTIDGSGNEIVVTAEPSLEEYTDFLSNYGEADGTVAWQEAYSKLSPGAQESVIANGATYEVLSSSNSLNYGVTSVVADGTELQYDGRNIYVPYTTEETWNSSYMEEYGQVIIDSAGAVNDTLSGEIESLKALNTSLDSNETFTSLPEDVQAQVKDYLAEQVSSRENIRTKIENDCSKSAFAEDGAVGNAVSVSKSTDYESYLDVVKVANSWNDSLSQIDNLQTATAYLNSHGILFGSGK